MNATKHSAPASQDERIAFGGYSRDGADHTLVATRDHTTPWRLLDVAGETVTVVESFFRDEGPDAVRAVAALYLAEMRSCAPLT